MKKILKEWNKYLLKEVSQFRDIMRILSGERGTVFTIGMMTPENPNAEQLPQEENDRLLKDFERRLKEKQLGFRKIRGKFGNKERSYIIPNIRRDEIVELGKEFGQEAVIWGEKDEEGKMIFSYIEGDRTLQQRDVVLTGDDIDARTDFYSQEPGGPEKHSITYPKKGKGKPLTRTARKFVIPFFDEEYEIEDESEDYTPEEPSEELQEEFKIRLKRIFKENATQKSRLMNRKILKYRCLKD